AISNRAHTGNQSLDPPKALPKFLSLRVFVALFPSLDSYHSASPFPHPVSLYRYTFHHEAYALSYCSARAGGTTENRLDEIPAARSPQSSAVGVKDQTPTNRDALNED
ncbi:hypothetical protein PQX77_016704, partial [Marasmius sp. AFHP31]